MHSEIGAEHTVVPWTLGILDDAGVPLRKDHRVLDFRCETGLRVYEFRAYGFCAMGFDTHNRVTVREEADKDWFIFSDDACRYHIPQPDNTFDFVFSGGLEHVRDYDAAFQEIHRVLKPGGTSLQVCPARWRPIEKHFYVPLGGRFHSHPYLLFWAALGIRHGRQKGKSYREVAHENWRYAQTELRYHSAWEILLYARRYFKRLIPVEQSFIKHTQHLSFISRVSHRTRKLFPPVVSLFAGFHTRVFLLEKGR